MQKNKKVKPIFPFPMSWRIMCLCQGRSLPPLHRIAFYLGQISVRTKVDSDFWSQKNNFYSRKIMISNALRPIVQIVLYFKIDFGSLPYRSSLKFQTFYAILFLARIEELASCKSWTTAGVG